MRTIAALLIACAVPAAAETVTVPSGQPVEFAEWLVDPEGNNGLTWRFRFVAPEIARDGGSVSVDTALGDIDALCAQVAAPRAAESDAPPGQVVITLMDRMVPFGTPAPEATQYFEAYTIDGDTCIWERF